MSKPRPTNGLDEARRAAIGKARRALVLQGGGALGAYQAGVYAALCETQAPPQWVAGVSIGAINAALIAGNPPGKRVERLREFWELVSSGPAQRLPPWLATREALNQWIRTSGVFDGVVDADKVLRDPAQPKRLLLAYDSGDHLHPNTDGGRAVANSIDLRLLRHTGR